MKTGFALLLVASLAIGTVFTGPDHAEGHTVIITNWKPCATGIQHDEPSFDEIPAWARAKSLRPYYYYDPRVLANHGLCNAKFHLVVLCLPGWEESLEHGDWYKVCNLWGDAK
jgi:hypothetical protein